MTANLTLRGVVPEPEPAESTEVRRPDLDSIEPGDWFWVTTICVNRKYEKEPMRWLGCVDEIGSNYFHVQEPHREHRDWRSDGRSARIHFNDFYKPAAEGGAEAAWVANADEVIKSYIAHHESRVHALMENMKEITARLGMAPTRELRGGQGDVSALSTVLSGQSYDDYKAALVKAQKEELPEVFKRIEFEHAQLAKWMSAELIPMRAKARDLSRATDNIENRIFNVELYAGLIEHVVEVRKGKPAALEEPLHLVQRRHYMDEECLARYEAGGMRFEDIGAFDKWIARDEQMKRLLPFERCMVAFRVRRYDIQQHCDTLAEWFALWDENQACRKTYLYIRNGERLYRLSTGVDFGANLFPDMSREMLDGRKLWAVMQSARGGIASLITDADYRERLRLNEESRLRWESMYHTRTAEPCTCEWVFDEDGRYANKGRQVVKKWCDACNSLLHWHTKHDADHMPELHVSERMSLDSWMRENHKPDRTKYEPFDRTSVFYDDTLKHVREIQTAHNRIALVVQGLLDRSPVLHPHPPWQIWTPEGFEAGVRLVYDETRALTPGEAPDFESYRKRLNASLKPGDVTIGQEAVWLESRREKREEMSEKTGSRFYFRDNDHGPGRIAEVKRLRGRGADRTATFTWTRKSMRGKKRWVSNPNRPGWGHWERDYDDIPVKIEVPVDALFNVSAYTPGDFRQFFDDPRTRADYLKWAPILLAAEEWHAGRKSGTPERYCTSCDHRHEFGASCPFVRESDGAMCRCSGHSGPKWSSEVVEGDDSNSDDTEDDVSEDDVYTGDDADGTGEEENES